MPTADCSKLPKMTLSARSNYSLSSICLHLKAVFQQAPSMALFLKRKTAQNDKGNVSKGAATTQTGDPDLKNKQNMVAPNRQTETP